MAKVTSVLFMLLLFCLVGEGFAATVGQLVDPMRPVHYQNQVNKKSAVKKQVQVKTREWYLTTVLISQGRSVAVINGKPLQVGEQLEDYELVQIRSDQVILKNKQEKLVLRRAGTGLKKISKKRDIGKGSKP